MHLPPTQAGALLVEHDLVAALDTIAEMRFDLRKRQRGGEEDAALCGGAGNLADGEERLTCKRRGRIEIGAAAVGEQEGTASAAAPGDAIRIGESEEKAGSPTLVATPLPVPPPQGGRERCGTGLHITSALICNFGPALCHCARVLCAARAVASQLIEAMGKINVIAAEATFSKQERGISRERGILARIHHHARKP